METSSQFQARAALPPRKNAGNRLIEGWVVPEFVWTLRSRQKTLRTGWSEGRLVRPADSALPTVLSRLQELSFNITWLNLLDSWLAVTMHSHGRLSSVSVGLFSSRTTAQSTPDLNFACYTRCPPNGNNPPTHCNRQSCLLLNIHNTPIDLT